MLHIKRILSLLPQSKDKPQVDMDEALDKARTELENRFRNNISPSPVTVLENVSKETFQNWIKNYEGHIHPEFIADDQEGDSGKIIVKDLALNVHEITASSIVRCINAALHKFGIPFVEQSYSSACPTCQIGNVVKEPDYSFKPPGMIVGGPVKQDVKGRPLPTLVVEIAHTNESEGSLISDLEQWLSPLTSVQIAIGVKILKQENEFKFYCFCRSNESEITRLYDAVKFGGSRRCVRPGIGRYQIDLPISFLYFGTRIPEQLKEEEFISFDLYDVKETILKFLQ